MAFVQNGTHRPAEVEAFLTTKPPVQYGKTAVKLKCYKAQSTRLLGFEAPEHRSVVGWIYDDLSSTLPEIIMVKWMACP